MASGLFQDETDEPSPAGDPSKDAGICQDDSDDNYLFQDELDDPESDDAPTLFQAEPDEPFCSEPSTTPVASFLPEPEVTQGKRPPIMLFEDEPDEASDSECSAYDADDELGQPREKSFVNLSFSTVSQFLASQLCKSSTPTTSGGPPKKKRCYNNEARQAKAASRKEEKQATTQKQFRVSRNDIEPSLC